MSEKLIKNYYLVNADVQRCCSTFFLIGAVQEIKSMVLSPPSKTVPVPMPTKKERASSSSLSNVTTTEKLDGSLELSFGSRNLTVQIVCDDISKAETTDLIMHVTSQDFSFQGGVGKALIKAGGDSIVQECKALGQPALFSTQYTKAGNLSVNEIAHVIGPDQPTFPDLKRCLHTFFDDVSKKNIGKVSFSAIGAGAMGFSESQSAELIFDNLSRIAESKNPTLNLVRIVIFERAKFVKFKDASTAYFSSGGATSLSPQAAKSSHLTTLFSMFRSKKSVKRTAGDEGVSVKIYSDGRGKIKKAWAELKRKMSQNIQEKIMIDDVIKKFTDHDLEILRKLERDFDVLIKADQSKGKVKIKGHISDISSIQDEIRKIMKKITENEIKGKSFQRILVTSCFIS
jgi:O-acetyl-ADP-ribose deacetylase (regulator of RNase III)